MRFKSIIPLLNSCRCSLHLELATVELVTSLPRCLHRVCRILHLARPAARLPTGKTCSAHCRHCFPACMHPLLCMRRPTADAVLWRIQAVLSVLQLLSLLLMSNLNRHWCRIEWLPKVQLRAVCRAHGNECAHIHQCSRKGNRLR